MRTAQLLLTFKQVSSALNTHHGIGPTIRRIPPVFLAMSQWRKAGSDHIRGLPRHLFTRGATDE